QCNGRGNESTETGTQRDEEQDLGEQDHSMCKSISSRATPHQRAATQNNTVSLEGWRAVRLRELQAAWLARCSADLYSQEVLFCPSVLRSPLPKSSPLPTDWWRSRDHKFCTAPTYSRIHMCNHLR